MRLPEAESKAATKSLPKRDFVADLLKTFDQDFFVHELNDILAAVQSDLEIRLTSEVGEGMRVKKKSGRLRSVEGWVEARCGTTAILHRFDFIEKAAAVRRQVHELEPAWGSEAGYIANRGGVLHWRVQNQNGAAKPARNSLRVTSCRSQQRLPNGRRWGVQHEELQGRHNSLVLPGRRYFRH